MGMRRTSVLLAVVVAWGFSWGSRPIRRNTATRKHRSRDILRSNGLSPAATGYPPQQPQPQNQAPQDANGAPDQPGQPVARLGVINGEASVRRGDSGEWVAAALNAPLMAGDSVSVGPNGSAELQLDSGNFVRHFRRNRNAHLRPRKRPQSDSDRQRIDHLSRPAGYQHAIGDQHSGGCGASPPCSAVRVEVAPDGSTRIIVRHGDAEVSTPRGTEHIHEGNMMLVRGSPDEPEYQIVYAAGAGRLGQLERSAGRVLEGAQSNRYLSQDIQGAKIWMRRAMGYTTLRMGTCGLRMSLPPGRPIAMASGFGRTTTAGPGWITSLGDGRHFTTVRGISAQASAGAGFPARRYGHYWWHPAMVGFFGFGGAGFGVGFGFGNVGWVPLAPFEVFHPWYGRGWYGGRGVLVAGAWELSTTSISTTRIAMRGSAMASRPSPPRIFNAAYFEIGSVSIARNYSGPRWCGAPCPSHPARIICALVTGRCPLRLRVVKSPTSGSSAECRHPGALRRRVFRFRSSRRL